jgi:hypothetical protein
MTIKETIEKWCLGIQQELISERPNDDWPKELESNVVEQGNGYKATIEGPNYVYWLNYGRGPTSPSKRGRLYGIMYDWVQRKGITAQGISQKSLAYLIARKIDRQGYTGKDFIDKVFTGKVELLDKDLTVLYVSQIRSEIIKQWQSKA